MKIIKYPSKEDLPKLLRRPKHDADETKVLEILWQVQVKGDEQLRKYSLQFDKVRIKGFRVSASEIRDAIKKGDKKLERAILTACRNIQKFHAAQKQKVKKIETTKGVVCWRESRPIEEVGLYIPGGSAPLFSTVLMLAIPAKLAGCKRIVMCTPPDKKGGIHPAILLASQYCGVDEIYKVGGAQAIGAMAYGTESIRPVQKIFGPGNSYVTMAKQLAQKDGVAIDMPAGPSEVLVVADETADPSFIAADLLSQAEHGPDSQVIFVSLTENLLREVECELTKQLKDLPRKTISQDALSHSKFFLVKTKQDAVDIINEYAPEHLIIAAKDEKYFLKNVNNAGSVFIGNYTPESAGDYASGTNHTLPTNGYARAYSGVSLDSFVKKITYQKISKGGIRKLGNTIETMAEAEGLLAHKNAVGIRLKKIK